MSDDFRPLLPRLSANADNLRRLRERALARMRQDEMELAPVVVTRRWSLKGLGLLIAGLTPVGAMLRGQAAFAAGMRCNAPQYGAPMPQPKPEPPCPPDYSEPPSNLPKPVLAPAPGPAPAPAPKPAPAPAPAPPSAPAPTPAAL
jgi:outer membrane biosynthesis protein TonB